MKINLEELRIIVKVVDVKPTKAIIALDFGDFLVKGFRIMESKFDNRWGEKLWLTPPTYHKGSGPYHPLFFTPNKNLWKEIEEKIMDAYRKQSEEHYRKRMELDEDEVPI